MTILEHWLARKPSADGLEGSQGSQVFVRAKKDAPDEPNPQKSAAFSPSAGLSKEEEEESLTIRACRANPASAQRQVAKCAFSLERKPASPASPQRQARVAWVDRPDVITVVEDLADEGMRPGKISRELGLTRGELIMILRRTGR